MSLVRRTVEVLVECPATEESEIQEIMDNELEEFISENWEDYLKERLEESRGKLSDIDVTTAGIK